MRMWKLILVLALSTLGSSQAKACGDFGCGDSWGGLYGVGDYNLYSFGSGMYDLGSYYGSGYDSYGGGCGSLLSSCGGGYDMAGLYGDSWGLGNSGGSWDIGINIDIVPTYTSSCGGEYSYCSGYNPYMQGMDMGCSIGYCDGGYTPYYGSDYDYSNPLYDPFAQYYNQVPPSYYPQPYYPTYGSYPRDPYQNPWIPEVPPSIPPYGVCDNILIPCPGGIITRQPQILPRNQYALPRNPGYPTDPFPPYYPPGNPAGYPPTHNDPYPPVVLNPPVIPPVFNPPTNYPPVITNYPPVVLPPVNNPPNNPPVVPQPPVLPGNPPGGSTTNTGSRPPVRNDIPRGM